MRARPANYTPHEMWRVIQAPPDFAKQYADCHCDAKANHEFGKEQYLAPELLTDEEHKIVEDLGAMWNRFCTVVPPGMARENDLQEAMVHIHALQNMVLSQAARRAFPQVYRMLGGPPVVGEAKSDNFPDNDPEEGRAHS